MDTVHAVPVKRVDITNDGTATIISSPQGIGGDDRCGVYMIQRLIAERGLRPTVIFCEDEEIGGVGSDILCRNKTILTMLSTEKLFIELDRAHANDLVYYYDDNKEFHDWCAKVTGWKEDHGSFSDISNFCPETGIAGVNLSCGYYKAHTTDEYVVWEEMIAAIDAAEKLIKAAADVEQFDYVERKPVYTSLYGNKRSSYESWYYDDVYIIEYVDENLETQEEIYEAMSRIEAIGYWAEEHPTLPYGNVMQCYLDTASDDDYWSWYRDKKRMGLM
jgi:hypothetical protein